MQLILFYFMVYCVHNFEPKLELRLITYFIVYFSYLRFFASFCLVQKIGRPIFLG